MLRNPSNRLNSEIIQARAEDLIPFSRVWARVLDLVDKAIKDTESYASSTKSHMEGCRMLKLGEVISHGDSLDLGNFWEPIDGWVGLTVTKELLDNHHVKIWRGLSEISPWIEEELRPYKD